MTLPFTKSINELPIILAFDRVIAVRNERAKPRFRVKKPLKSSLLKIQKKSEIILETFDLDVETMKKLKELMK